jgi:hypothetical protein
MRISNMKTKTMVFQGKNHIRCEVVIDNKMNRYQASNV